jgi:hypothetical protein
LTVDNEESIQSQAVSATANTQESMNTVARAITPHMDDGTCNCDTSSSVSLSQIEPAYVYALGRIEARFPSLSIEKEFAQATGRAETAGQADREALYTVLSDRQNRYLVRQMCWIFTIEGLDTYILQPSCPADLELLVEAIRPTDNPFDDVDVVIGRRGPIAPPQMCNGLMVPIVAFEQIYSFDIESLLNALPRPESVEPERFRAAAEELFLRIMQVADNAGSTNEHRALNYLAVRYDRIYAQTVDAFGRSCALTGVEVKRSRLSAGRKIMDVIFAYTNRQTDVIEKFFVRIDVTGLFPFLLTKLSPYYDRII